jgi:hypothetical protein
MSGAPATAVGAEEEELVFDDRPAQNAAEIVLPQFGLARPLALANQSMASSWSLRKSSNAVP